MNLLTPILRRVRWRGHGAIYAKDSVVEADDVVNLYRPYFERIRGMSEKKKKGTSCNFKKSDRGVARSEGKHDARPVRERKGPVGSSFAGR